MPAVTRRGFTLPELLVALILLGVLGAATLTLMRGTEDTTRAHAQLIDVRQNLRIAAAFLPIELRELDAAEGDLVTMGRAAITIRAQRRLAVLCRPPQPGPDPGSLVLTVRDAPSAGARDFNPAGDSVLVFADGDPGTPDDDSWTVGSFGALLPDRCPDGGSGRRFMAVLRPVPGRPWGDWGIASGAPVQGFETVTYRLYRSSEDGRWYVGQQSAGDVQPVLGPVTNDGLAFTFLDSSGVVTTEPSRVALIDVQVRARTLRPIRNRQGGLEQPLDSVHVVVWLRNNRRF